MSPRTSTWTEILGSFPDPDEIVFGGECFVYLLGSMRRIAVKIVDRMTAKVKSISSIVTWLDALQMECKMLHTRQITRAHLHLTPYLRQAVRNRLVVRWILRGRIDLKI